MTETGNGQAGYRVVYLDAAHRRLKELAVAASDLGVRSAFAGYLRRMNAVFESRPHEYGDPQFDYHHLGMTRYRAQQGFLVVYYAISELDRVVYVQEVEANPYGPLAGPSPNG